MNNTQLDRQLGAIIGMAIGDALGAAVEFRRPGSFPPVTGYRGGGPHPIDPGDWTDDTSMALAIADSLASEGITDRDDMMARFAKWKNEGRYSVNGRCFDIGIQTSSAIRIWEETGDLSQVPAEDRNSGNGSIMRLAPVPVFFASNTLEEAVQASRMSSATTHPSQLCVDSCGVLGALLWDCINDGIDGNFRLAQDMGGGRFDAVKWAIERVPSVDDLHPRILERLHWADSGNKPCRASGFVLDTLHAALWCFSRSRSFDEAVLRAVNLGDDADTVGAVCGQIAGAFYGIDGISESLLDGLGGKPFLSAACRQLTGADPFGFSTLGTAVPRVDST